MEDQVSKDIADGNINFQGQWCGFNNIFYEICDYGKELMEKSEKLTFSELEIKQSLIPNILLEFKVGAEEVKKIILDTLKNYKEYHKKPEIIDNTSLNNVKALLDKYTQESLDLKQIFQLQEEVNVFLAQLIDGYEYFYLIKKDLYDSSKQ
jgi:hypothetical protein